MEDLIALDNVKGESITRKETSKTYTSKQRISLKKKSDLKRNSDPSNDFMQRTSLRTLQNEKTNPYIPDLPIVLEDISGYDNQSFDDEEDDDLPDMNKSGKIRSD